MEKKYRVADYSTGDGTYDKAMIKLEGFDLGINKYTEWIYPNAVERNRMKMFRI